MTRVTLTQNGIEYVLPTVYHGDPIRSQGALVMTDFGRDILGMNVWCGFDITIQKIKITAAASTGIDVFMAVKNR